MINYKPEYLGDGVYATWDGYQIRLSLDGQDMSDTVIYIEPSVLEALNLFYKKCINKESN